MLTFDRLPDLDAQGRPKMFYSQRVHDKCYRRPHFDAGQFVERFDDAGARMGYCLYKVGCKGPVTYNACSATALERGAFVPDPVGTRLHRLFRRRVLGQGLVLRSPDHDHARPGCSASRAPRTRSASAWSASPARRSPRTRRSAPIKQARSKSRNDKVSEVED